MRQKALYLAGCCLLCLVSACSSKVKGVDFSPAEHPEAIMHMSGVTQADAAAAVPPGMRLGAPYVSALGENCYEVLPAADAVAPARALCLHGQSWALLPFIYMDTPAGGVAVARP